LFPLNSNILLHKEIRFNEKATTTQQKKQSKDILILLNTTTGKSGEYFQILIQHCNMVGMKYIRKIFVKENLFKKQFRKPSVIGALL
jgi:hypothetical protein